MNPYIERLKSLRERAANAACQAGRKQEAITLLAVGKGHEAAELRLLAEAGQSDFGESYLQEALAKQQNLADLALNWHFIGHLQKNKAAMALGRFRLIHSLDSIPLAEIIDKKALKAGLRQPVLLQVNLAMESSKHGVPPEQLEELADKAATLPNLELRGLMCLPPPSSDPEDSRPYFAKLRQLRDKLETCLGQSLPELSMGMSHDFAQAVAEGATIIRIGTALLGERKAK